MNVLMMHQPSVSHSQLCDASPAPVTLTILGDGLRRLFVVWNRAYKPIGIVASDATEALNMAEQARHMRRASAYRRFEDCTERALAGEEIPGVGAVDDTDAILNSGRAGVLSRSEAGWMVGGCLVNAP